MPEQYDTIQWSFDEETGVGTIILDRPNSMNALTAELREDVVAGLDAFRRRDEEADGVGVRALVIEGAGDRAFCAGADINEFTEVRPGHFEMGEVFEACDDFPAPVVAKIDGYCLGGGLELALSCDFRIASERSTVGQPEVDLGIIPGGGGTVRLASLVGPARTKEICMTGAKIEATEAAKDGIVDHVYPANELDDRVDEFVETIAGKPPLSVRAVKDVVNTAQEVGMRAARRYERRAVSDLRNTADHAQSVEAFREDRDPEWVGK